MPRHVTDNQRMELRLKPGEKALLSRAAALQRQDLTGFILSSVLPRAEAVVREAERLDLSERDSLRVLDLLDNPPTPSDRLIRAARSGNRLV